jgi:NAD(P)-dependent dehydrogenase (short-subunit alcohol dehydrogenase family)
MKRSQKREAGWRLGHSSQVCLPTSHTVTGCVLSCPGMWGLVNNAGISTFGEVEFTSMETYKEVAEVNLWGTVRTTKSFLPLLRRAKGKSGRQIFLPTHPGACQHP